MTRDSLNELHTLLSAVVDGTASEMQCADLTKRLAEDAEARRFYLRYLDMSAGLMGRVPPVPASSTRRGPWFAILTSSLMAASLLVGWFVSASARRNETPAIDGSVPSAGSTLPLGYVATILSASPTATLNDQPISPGMRLLPAAYVLANGSLEIQFDGGSRILFDGTSRFSLVSRRRVTIEQATFLFRGDPSCETIEIATPRSILRDIGTEYAAVIDGALEEVHVSDGSVQRSAEGHSSPSLTELIEAGAARRYESLSQRGVAIPLNAALIALSLDAPVAADESDNPTAYDGFKQGADGIQGLQSGYGWSGPWLSRKDSSLRLCSPGLAGEGSVSLRHAPPGSDGSDGNVSAAHRRLDTPIDLSKDGIYYLRYLVRRGPVGKKREHRAMIVLRTHGVSLDDEERNLSLIQIALRKHDSALVRLGEAVSRASLPQVPDQTYAVVAKIVAGSTKPDQVLVRLMAIDQLAEPDEPSDWSLVSDSVETDMLLDTLSLESTSDGQIEFGDICIGPSWKSVSLPRTPLLSKGTPQ